MQRKRILRRLEAALAPLVQRKDLVVIRDPPRTFLAVARELDLAFVEGLAVVPAEDREQQPAAAALPVDVEELGVRRGAALREHVLPPGVSGGRTPQWVGQVS